MMYLDEEMPIIALTRIQLFGGKCQSLQIFALQLDASFRATALFVESLPQAIRGNEALLLGMIFHFTERSEIYHWFLDNLKAASGCDRSRKHPLRSRAALKRDAICNAANEECKPIVYRSQPFINSS
jgi:hypothetical protein